MHLPWLPEQVSVEPQGATALWAFVAFVVTLPQALP